MLSSLSMSCSDDDDNDNDGRTAEEIAQDPYAKDTPAGDALLTLVSQLATTADTLPDNWKTATFEPTIGKVLGSNQYERTITVANSSEALRRYNSLTGKNLPEGTTTDTYTVDGVGTLTFTATSNSAETAVVDVNIKQMPHLQKLRMVPANAIGENGTFKGEPYYRFGDVVKDKDGYYWICVRPAYSPDSKEDTHWMSLQMSKDNITTVTGKGMKDQVLPTGIDCNTEKLDYLPRLLAILARPEEYLKIAGKEGKYYGNMGLGGLQADAMPPDTLYWQAKLWEKYKVWEMIVPSKNLNIDMVRTDFGKDVNLIYKKYSKSGKNFTLYLMQYTGAGNFYKNIPTPMEIKWNGTDYGFDINKDYISKGRRLDQNNPVPDAYVVRYKTGFKLSSNWVFNPDPTKAIEGVTEIYRYNAHRHEISSLNVNTFVGDGYFHIGDIIRDNKTGYNWLCYQACGPAMAASTEVKDQNAYFLSFDGIPSDSLIRNPSSYYTAEVPYEEYILRLAAGFGAYIKKVRQGDGTGGAVDPFYLSGENMKQRCGVDVLNMMVERDSTTVFVGEKTETSKSTNFFLNYAYVDEAQTYTTKNQPIMRVIYDMTEAGTARVGTAAKDWKTHLFKKYPNSQERMYITDVMDQDKVTRYGSADPWVTLPWHGQTERNKPRTTTYDFKYMSYYYWNTKLCRWAHPEVRSMYYEPIIFLRMMTKDNSQPADLKGYTIIYQIPEKFQVSADAVFVSNTLDATKSITVDGEKVNIYK